jgi:hypothetical protein
MRNLVLPFMMTIQFVLFIPILHLCSMLRLIAQVCGMLRLIILHHISITMNTITIVIGRIVNMSITIDEINALNVSA